MCRRAFQNRLIILRQGIPLLQIGERVDRRAALPETGIVIKLGDLLKTELLVVIGSDPLGGVDRALLERRVDLATGNLLRHHANLLQHLAGNSSDAKLQSGEIGNGLDLLAEPAAHLGAGIAGVKSDHAEFLEELVSELRAATLIPPGVLLARIQAERHRGIDGKGRILADVIITSGVAHLEGAIGSRVKRLQAGHDFTCGKDLDLKLVIGHFGDILRKLRGAAIDRIERLREA